MIAESGGWSFIAIVFIVTTYILYIFSRTDSKVSRRCQEPYACGNVPARQIPISSRAFYRSIWSCIYPDRTKERDYSNISNYALWMIIGTLIVISYIFLSLL